MSCTWNWRQFSADIRVQIIFFLPFMKPGGTSAFAGHLLHQIHSSNHRIINIFGLVALNWLLGTISGSMALILSQTVNSSILGNNQYRSLVMRSFQLVHISRPKTVNLLKIHDFQVENGEPQQMLKGSTKFRLSSLKLWRNQNNWVIRRTYGIHVPAFALSHIKFSKGLKEHIYCDRFCHEFCATKRRHKSAFRIHTGACIA